MTYLTRTTVFDCSVLDMGVSLVDAVRGHAEYARLPIVLVSDTPEKADAALSVLRTEHILLIPKPFTASHIARALDDLLK